MGLDKKFIKVYGLEIISESSFERFEEKHGTLANYDRLLVHVGINNQSIFMKKINDLKIPIAIGTLSPGDYKSGKVPILSYSDEKSIADFFLNNSRTEEKI